MSSSNRISSAPGSIHRPKKICQTNVIASEGVKTTTDLARLASAMISDLANDRISPQRANAMANCGRLALKVAEAQFKYGTDNGKQNRPLELGS